MKRRPAPLLAVVALLSGCVVVPRTVMVPDPNCGTYARQMTLEVEVIGGFQRCGGNECGAMLVAAGVVTAASAIVSGSIIVIGNIAYWLERRGGCPG